MAPVAVEGQPKVRDLEVADELIRKLSGLMSRWMHRSAWGLFYADNYFRNVESCLHLVQRALPDQEAEEVAARHVLHDQIEVGGVLETGNQRDDPVRPSLPLAARTTSSMGSTLPHSPPRPLRRNEEISLCS